MYGQSSGRERGRYDGFESDEDLRSYFRGIRSQGTNAELLNLLGILGMLVVLWFFTSGT